MSIQSSMQAVLDGKISEGSVEIITTAKILEAADLLAKSGFEDEAQLVLSSLSTPIQKQASAKEEFLFEVSLDD